MFFCRRYFPQARVLILLCAVFLSCMIATPFAYSRRTGTTATAVGFDGGGITGFLILQESKTDLISEASGKEFVNGMRLSFITNRSLQSFHNNILRILNILCPFVGFSLLIYCFGYFNRRNTKHKSIMAGSLGGHDPPQILRMIS